MFDWKLDEEPSDVVLPPSIHEQADGTVLAMAVTGSASKDSLVYWIKFLERTNPKLAQVPIVFLLQTPETGLEVVTDSRRPTKLLSQ
jgi:signaling intermediate in Toll pathway protein